jgi:outer membrane beta-barrel protein
MMRQILVGLWAVLTVPLVTATFVSPAYAADPAEEDEYNFSWLDPDKKVYVLQNRKYQKAKKLALFVQGGANLSNPYRSELMGIPRASYWFTEQFGVEAFFSLVDSAENDNFNALENVSASALPFVRKTKSYFGALFTWTPWYAKINMFNKILYFDWFIFAGGGQMGTAINLNNRAGLAANFRDDTHFAAYFGTGQTFYVTRHFLVRWDLIGAAFKAAGADNRSESTRTNYDFALGVGYLF